MEWYEVENIDEIDSPALLIYKDRMISNIHLAIDISGDKHRLRPHVKTHKIPEVIRIHIELGIDKFKCATIAEAEMVAEAGGRDILLAHQPTGPKIWRLVQLAMDYPQVKFSTLIDDSGILKDLSDLCQQHDVFIGIWLDIDNGMHRSGIEPGTLAVDLYQWVEELPFVYPMGLHVYDGHLRSTDFEERKSRSDEGFELVYQLTMQLQEKHLKVPSILAGGTPTFPVHAQRDSVELSPGTYIFWDFGYGDILPDLKFQHAAVLATRIISRPGSNRVCVDLGHKAIAAEKPHPRVRWLNVQADKFLIHSEEHLVFESPEASKFQVGDVVYGIPVHICPTVALHQQVYVVEDHQVHEQWTVLARNRKLSI